MQREELKPALVTAPGILAIGFILVRSIVSMRMAYHRAYTEIASSCRQTSLFVLESSKYFCASVARVETVVAERTRPIAAHAALAP